MHVCHIVKEVEKISMTSSQAKSSSYPVLYSSGIGSISAAIVSTPFDVVKNYLQVCIFTRPW